MFMTLTISSGGNVSFQESFPDNIAIPVTLQDGGIGRGSHLSRGHYDRPNFPVRNEVASSNEISYANDDDKIVITGPK